jgi:hypothetical protein
VTAIAFGFKGSAQDPRALADPSPSHSPGSVRGTRWSANARRFVDLAGRSESGSDGDVLRGSKRSRTELAAGSGGERPHLRRTLAPRRRRSRIALEGPPQRGTARADRLSRHDEALLPERRTRSRRPGGSPPDRTRGRPTVTRGIVLIRIRARAGCASYSSATSGGAGGGCSPACTDCKPCATSPRKPLSATACP